MSGSQQVTSPPRPRVRPAAGRGLALLLVGAFMALLDTTIVNVAGRVVQGLGAGVFFPAIAALIQLLYAGPARGRAFGALGAVVGLSTALGPLVGGLLIQGAGVEHGWRWVFLANVPIGAGPQDVARAFVHSAELATLASTGLVLVALALVLHCPGGSGTRGSDPNVVVSTA